MKNWVKFKYPKVEFITVSLKEAIDNDVLPDPKVLLIPLTLDNTNSTEVLVKKNKKSTLTIDCFYKDRWKYMKLYNCNIKCTPQQYYTEISQEIEYWKKQSMFKKSFEFKWLKCCNDRLKWLSNQKNETILLLLKKLKGRAYTQNQLRPKARSAKQRENQRIHGFLPAYPEQVH